MASFDECVDQLAQAGKGLFSRNELVNMLAEQDEALAKQAALRDTFDDQVLNQDDLADVSKFKDSLIYAARDKALNKIARETAKAFIKTFDDATQGVEAFLVGLVGKRQPKGRASIAAQQKAIGRELKNDFVNDMDDIGVTPAEFNRYMKGEDEVNLARELDAVSRGEPAATKDVMARQLAELIHKHQLRVIARLNRHGARIAPLEGFVMSQTHDVVKINRATLPQWVADVRGKLDLQKMGVSEKQVDEFLRQVHRELAFGSHLVSGKSDDVTDFVGFSNIAERMSKHRVLHFKTPEDLIEYNRKYGVSALPENVITQFDRAADEIALLRNLGPNPKANFKRIIKDLVGELSDTGPKGREQAAKLINKEKGIFGIYMDVLDGTSNIPGNVPWSRAFAVYRAITTMAKLGAATLSSFPDIASRVINARQSGVNLFEAYASAFATPFKGKGSKKMQRMAGDLGEGIQAQLGEIMSRFVATDTLPGAMHKAMNAFFKYSLLTWWTQSHRTGQAVMLSRMLGRNITKTFDQLEGKSVLQQYFNAAQWDVLRKHAVRQHEDGANYLVPNAVRDIPDDVMEKLIGTKNRRQITTAREDLEIALRSYYVDQADFAIPTPGARENAIIRGHQPGTVFGELQRSFFQFKAFPITFANRVLRGTIANKEFGGFVHLFIAMSVMGYAALALKDLSKRREIRTNLSTDRRLIIDSLLQGGGLGIYGDFLFSDVNRYGSDVLSTLGGPAFGDGVHIVKQPMNLIDMARGLKDGDDIAASNFRFMMQHVPFQNLFYTRWATDYLITQQVLEAIKPGTQARMERRLIREKDQRMLTLPF